LLGTHTLVSDWLPISPQGKILKRVLRATAARAESEKGASS